jgi:uncharacterized phiE125 gp8 family phage protein
MLIRLTRPDGFFVSVNDVKAHVVIDTADDDALIEAYIRAATLLAEDRTGRILMAADFEYRTDRWCDPMVVPVAPVRDVVDVLYLDEDDVERSLDAGTWYEVVTAEGAEIRFTDSFTSPALSSRPQAVRVRFSAGYDVPDASGSGDDPELEQNEMDRLIVLLLVANWYQVREPIAIGDQVAEIPFSVKSLIEVRRIFR